MEKEKRRKGKKSHEMDNRSKKLVIVTIFVPGFLVITSTSLAPTPSAPLYSRGGDTLVLCTQTQTTYLNLNKTTEEFFCAFFSSRRFYLHLLLLWTLLVWRVLSTGTEQATHWRRRYGAQRRRDGTRQMVPHLFSGVQASKCPLPASPTKIPLVPLLLLLLGEGLLYDVHSVSGTNSSHIEFYRVANDDRPTDEMMM